MDDLDLLRQYVADGSEGGRGALDELIRRHVPMVYAAALREVRDPHLAEDVTQAAFVVLMRRAPALCKSRNVLLAGWLFHVVHFTAADARKAQARRQHHERLAAEMRSEKRETQPDPDDHRLIPLLNDAIASLGARDRDAVVMCYLQGRSQREAAEAQHASENAIRQRLFRAMGKLRRSLRRQGVDASPMMIAAAMAHAAAQSAPPTLAPAICGALAAAHVAGPPALLANTTIRSMLMLKAKVISAACVAALALSTGVGFLAHAVAADLAAPATQPATQPGASATQPAGLGPAAQPLDTLKNLMGDLKAGDGDAFVSCFDQPSVEQVKTLKTIARVLFTASELRKAVADKLGDAAGNQINSVFGGAVMNPKAVDALKVTVTGDTAVVGEGDGAVGMVKIGDVWKVASGAKIEKVGPMFANIDQQLDGIKGLIADVKAGKYASADDVQKALVELLKPQPDNNGL